MDLPSIVALLPTPTASQPGGTADQHLERKRRMGRTDPTVTDLGMVVERLLPTPRTSDANGTGEHGTGGPDLRTAVSGLTPPQSDDTKRGTDPHPTPPPTGDSTPDSSSG